MPFQPVFLQYVLGSSPFANWAVLTLSLVILYYCFLSIPLMLGMLVFGITCIEITQFVVRNFEMALWKIALIIFLIAWIGQFYGHKIEGKKTIFSKRPTIFTYRSSMATEFYIPKTGNQILNSKKNCNIVISDGFNFMLKARIKHKKRD